MSKPQIRTATPSDKDRTVNTLVMAFSADPVVRWFYPEAQQYLANFPAFLWGFGGRAFDHDSAYYAEGFAGAAYWLPPDIHPDVDSLMPLIQETIAEEVQQDLFSILEQLDDYHPSEPHWYLPLIGVDPAYQARGIGSALMEHALARCDQEGLAAYLESTNPKNITLYQRFGFESVGTLQVGNSPNLYPMVRKAR